MTCNSVWRVILRVVSAVRAVAAHRSKKQPGLEAALVEAETGGDPEGKARYTRSSLRSLATRLGSGCATTVGRLLKPLGYSLKTNVKRLIGKVHPQRDYPYRLIQRVRGRFIRRGQPVISVDAKKAELIGNFKNAGQRYCRQADPVKAYDFPSEAQ
ncbi:MAG: hypothetical protein R3E95_04690 [Thiolinea sp.]